LSVLYVDNLQPNLGSRVMAAGHVVQTIHVSTNTKNTLSTQDARVKTGLTASITPTSTSSKILIVGDMCLAKDGGNAYAGIWLYKDGSEIVMLEDSALYTGDSGQNYNRFPLTYLDSPATTSSVEYAFYVAKEGAASANVFINTDNARSGITLMEIAQ